MSKEQTPITVEEIVDRYTEGNYLIGTTEKSEMVKELKQYAQAKVLEVLEREEEFFCDNSKITVLRNTLSNAEWRRLIKIHFRRSMKQK